MCNKPLDGVSLLAHLHDGQCALDGSCRLLAHLGLVLTQHHEAVDQVQQRGQLAWGVQWGRGLRHPHGSTDCEHDYEP